MVIDLAAYRRRKARSARMASAGEEERLCVNSQPARGMTAQRAGPAALLASLPLPAEDADMEPFQVQAYSLATQI